MIIFCEAGSKQTQSAKPDFKAASHGQEHARRMPTRIGWSAMSVLAMVFSPAAHAAQGAGLAWQGSSDPTVVGYNIYYGGASGNYTNVVSLGNVKGAAISGLSQGATYYFAATAIDANGAESGFSTEINYTVTVTTGTQLHVGIMPGGLYQLSGAGLVGHAYQILASTNLLTWTIIGTQTADGSGSFQFTDANAIHFPTRFYRTMDTQQ
jgi:hypothetical protein